jgi:hypothetical protein
MGVYNPKMPSESMPTKCKKARLAKSKKMDMDGWTVIGPQECVG